MGNGHTKTRFGRRTLDIMSIDPDEVEDIPYQNQRVQCRICSVYDGDSFTGLLDFHGYPVKIKIRLLGVDAPEKIPRGVKDEELRELEKRAAIMVRDRVSHIIQDKLVAIEMVDLDKYGRILSNIYINVDDGEQSLADWLITNGYVRPYRGQKKIPWTEAELLSGPYVL